MPWKEACAMTLRVEFVNLARMEGANIKELCDRFEISRKTGYKWLKRESEGGVESLSNRSRRPHRSPRQTSSELESRVLELRSQHPAWGGRKLRAVLLRRAVQKVPSASTITEILRRHGQLSGEDSSRRLAIQRFEHPSPNDLWQMDFKGHFGLEDSHRCHPLTVLDDHSRFNIGLRACANERGDTVRDELTAIFAVTACPAAC